MTDPALVESHQFWFLKTNFSIVDLFFGGVTFNIDTIVVSEVSEATMNKTEYEYVLVVVQ